MKNSSQKNLDPYLFAAAVILFAALMVIALPVSAANAWQEQQLYRPSEQQLSREQGGAVTMYSGFTDRQVSTALDGQFDRAEHMMFIKTVVTDSDGEVKRSKDSGEPVTEDDDC